MTNNYSDRKGYAGCQKNRARGRANPLRESFGALMDSYHYGDEQQNRENLKRSDHLAIMEQIQ